MARSSKPQDKGRYIHPKETSSWQEEVKQFEYVYTKMFRIVPPYKFEFGTSIKERWIGRPLVEVFSQEFPYFEDSVAYYTDALSKGRLRVNDDLAGLEYRCRDGDVVTHRVHRHEPPVSADPVQIIQITGDLVVVNKPASLPIHPGGRYRRNCLVAVLAKEHSLFDLYTVHRLDRLTSGVMLLARTKQVADQIRIEFENGTVSKKYLARVVGEVSTEPTIVDQPLRCKNHREAIHEIHPEGKASQTRVTLLATNGKESIVLCEPLTGRTHQIRLHLQWLGHPIANDPLYGPYGVGSTAKSSHDSASASCGSGTTATDEGNPAAGERDKSEAESAGCKRGGITSCDGEALEIGDECERRKRIRNSECKIVSEELAREDTALGLEKNGWLDPDCVHCRQSVAESCAGYYVAVKNKHDDSDALLIWLHALTNAGSTWAFSSPIPPWALQVAPDVDLASRIPGYVQPTQPA